MIVNKNDNLEFKKIYFNLQCIFAFHMHCHKYIFFTFFLMINVYFIFPRANLKQMSHLPLLFFKSFVLKVFLGIIELVRDK